jgi:hypothetical protein
MNDGQVLKGMKMKSKIENMAHEKREKNKQSEDEWLQTLSKEERRKILLDRLHKKTRHGMTQEDKFKELSEEIQRNPLAENGVEQLTQDDIRKRNQARRRKIKKIKQRIVKQYPNGIPDDAYFNTLEKINHFTDPNNKLYAETLISMYNKNKRSTGDVEDGDDLEF